MSERIYITARCVELLRHQDFFLSIFHLNHRVFMSQTCEETTPRTVFRAGSRRDLGEVRAEQAAERSQQRGSPAISHALSVEG